jgi:hypothetical protein
MDGATPVKLRGPQRLATMEAGRGFLHVPIMMVKKWALSKFHPAARHHLGRNPGPA